MSGIKLARRKEMVSLPYGKMCSTATAEAAEPTVIVLNLIVIHHLILRSEVYFF